MSDQLASPEIPQPQEVTPQKPIRTWANMKWHRRLLLFVLLPLLVIFLVAAILGKFLFAPSDRPMAILPQPQQEADRPLDEAPTTIPTVQPNQQGVLVTKKMHGGLCMGPCESNEAISAQGLVTLNTEFKGTLTSAELQKLSDLIVSDCCDELRKEKFNDVCPLAYDGQETIYTFYKDGAIEEIKSCEYVIPEDNPLIAYINELLDKHSNNY